MAGSSDSGFVSAFRTGKDGTEIASCIGSHLQFQTASYSLQHQNFVWSGTFKHEGRVEIWSEPEVGLFGLSILASAEGYFELRRTIHDLLEAQLVVTSVLDEISATYEAKRDILELHGQNLTELPPEIGMLTELEVLSLSNNRLTRLPDEIGRLSKLVELAIDENTLEELTPHIGQLTKLEILYLSHNKLRSLPAEIGKLAKLRRFNIDDNHLTELPAEFALLEGLRDFDWAKWHSNPRKGLPPRIIPSFVADGNPWIYPPAEVMKGKIKAIQEYLRANPIDAAAARRRDLLASD